MEVLFSYLPGWLNLVIGLTALTYIVLCREPSYEKMD